jgi:hypothetical protein
MRTAMAARTVRSVRENVGGGWGETDREGMTNYQKKCSGGDPKILKRRPPSQCVKETRSNRGAQVKRIDGGCRTRGAWLTSAEAARGAAVATIEVVEGEELDRPVRWGRCHVVDPEVVGTPSGDAPRKRTGPETCCRWPMANCFAPVEYWQK